MGRTWPDRDNEPPCAWLNGSPVPGHWWESRNPVVCMMWKEQLCRVGGTAGPQGGRAGKFCKNTLFEEPGLPRLVRVTRERGRSISRGLVCLLVNHCSLQLVFRRGFLKKERMLAQLPVPKEGLCSSATLSLTSVGFKDYSSDISPALCIKNIFKYPGAWFGLLVHQTFQHRARALRPHRALPDKAQMSLGPGCLHRSLHSRWESSAVAPEDQSDLFQSMRDLLFQSHVFHCKLIVSGMCGVPLIGIHSEASTSECFAARRASADTAVPPSRLRHRGSSRSDPFQSRSHRPGAGTSLWSRSEQAVPALGTSASVCRKYRPRCSPPLESPRRFTDTVWFVRMCGAGL